MRRTDPACAYILAAGLGSRLRPLTDSIPKCLVPIGGQPLLHWWLTICERLQIRRALINTHAHAPQVENFISKRVSTMEIVLSYEPNLLGSAGTLRANRQFVSGEKNFWIFYADTLIGANLKSLSNLHLRQQADLTMGLFKSDNPQSGGVVEINPAGRVVSFEEKPKNPKSNLIAAGAYLASQRLFDVLSPQAFDLSKDVYPHLMNNTYGVVLDPVIDLGTAENYQRAQQQWAKFGLK